MKKRPIAKTLRMSHYYPLYVKNHELLNYSHNGAFISTIICTLVRVSHSYNSYMKIEKNTSSLCRNLRCITDVNETGGLNPLHVSEVLTMRQTIVPRIHAECVAEHA